MTPSPATGARRFRLTGRGAYDALFRSGRRREGAYVQLLALPVEGTTGRAGFAIAKKLLPRAVDRNRVRRMFREVLRAARPAVESYDVILRLKRTCSRTQLRTLAAETRALVAGLVEGTPP